MEVIAFRRYLNKKNSSCLNYTLQVLAKVKKKEYNIGKVWSLKNVQTKNFLKNNTNKKILFWGIGSTFFQFTRGLKMQNYKNLNYTDIKGDGENILKFKRFKNQTFDILIICTAEHSQVKMALKKLNIKCKVVKYIN
jgi:hypothetical protein